MFRTCQRYTDDPHIALTILNDAFLKVFRSMLQYKEQLGSFRSWLKTVVINTAIDHTRKQKGENQVVHIDTVQERGDDDYDLHYTWNHEAITQHLKLLPPITRIVINLFAFDGYTYKDIAAQLDITEATSRWHVAEARKRLKKSMQLNQPKLARNE